MAAPTPMLTDTSAVANSRRYTADHTRPISASDVVLLWRISVARR
jgi:hypothetical protein